MLPARLRGEGIMSSISVLGILLGVVVHFLANMVWGLALAIGLASAGSADWNLLLPVGMTVGAAISVGAAYVAARAAGRGELLNGALSVLLATVTGWLVSRGFTSAEFEAEEIIALLVPAPLLGLFGGYLRLLQVRRRRA
jgi:hypothetical protein